MNHDILRVVAQITAAYLSQNSVDSSELPRLIEIIGVEVLKLHSNERSLHAPNSVAERTAQTVQTLIDSLQGHARSGPVGRMALYRADQRGRRSLRPPELPGGSAMRLTLAQHIEMVQRFLSEREQASLASSGSR